jgi:hypothetical protein
MTVSIFLTFKGPASDATALEAAFGEGLLHRLAPEPGMRFIETYRPAPGEVPSFAEGAGPPLLVELNLDTADDARRLISSMAFRGALTTGQAMVDVFHSVPFPLPRHIKPPPRTAPLSFVVRYCRPVADEQAFAAFYTLHHPPILARFPDIRNVLCYLPTGIELPAGVQPSGAFFGNEVVFDDLDSLNRALASDVLPLLKADGKRFAPFGHSSHHAMLRQAVYVRPE